MRQTACPALRREAMTVAGGFIPRFTAPKTPKTDTSRSDVCIGSVSRGSSNRSSSPQIPLVIINAVFVEDGAIFFLKRPGTVVFPLIFHIFDDFRQI